MKKTKIFTLLLIVLLVISQTSFALATGEAKVSVNDKIKEFSGEIFSINNIIIAFAITSSVLIFIIHFIRLASNSDNPNERRKILKDIFITGICTSLMGAVWIVARIIVFTFL